MKLKKFFMQNTSVKLLSLALAVALWFYVGVEQNPVTEKTYEVAVGISNLDDTKTATPLSSTVKITVRGRESRLASLDSNDFNATVNLANMEAGVHSVEIDVQTPRWVHLVKTNPNPISVDIEELEGQTMYVNLMRTGELPNGITLKEATVSQTKVFVTGSDYALSRMASVGVELDQSSILESGTIELPIRFYDDTGLPIENEELYAIPETVVVTTSVTETEVEKTVPVQAKLRGNLVNGYDIESVSVNPEEVTITGLPKEVSAISSVSTEAIDLSSLTQSANRSVAVDSDLVEENTLVTVNVTVALSDANGKNIRQAKVVPIEVFGVDATKVDLSERMVVVSYNLDPDMEDKDIDIRAFVDIDETSAQTGTAYVQFISGKGINITSYSLETIDYSMINEE